MVIYGALYEYIFFAYHFTVDRSILKSCVLFIILPIYEFLYFIKIDLRNSVTHPNTYENEQGRNKHSTGNKKIR